MRFLTILKRHYKDNVNNYFLNNDGNTIGFTRRGDRIDDAKFDFTFVLVHRELVKGTKCIYVRNSFRLALEKTNFIANFRGKSWRPCNIKLKIPIKGCI